MRLALLALLLDVSPRPSGPGWTVITEAAKGRIFAIDARGATAWTLDVGADSWPIGLAPARDGGVFVGAHGCVYDVDGKGRIRRTIPFKHARLLYATSLQPLPKGRFLVTDFNRGVTAEIDADGKILWEYSADRLTDARRLSNGLTAVVTAGGSLSEITAGGAVERTIPLDGKPIGLSVTASGNYLVALEDKGRVVEIDRNGREVWSYDVKFAYSATRLSSGHTLIAERGTGRILEVTRAGRIVWETKATSPRTAARCE
jgi:outer membrane protein assembly factor BamB